jgi:hypothetical protein
LLQLFVEVRHKVQRRRAMGAVTLSVMR